MGLVRTRSEGEEEEEEEEIKREGEREREDERERKSQCRPVGRQPIVVSMLMSAGSIPGSALPILPIYFYSSYLLLCSCDGPM